MVILLVSQFTCFRLLDLHRFSIILTGSWYRVFQQPLFYLLKRASVPRWSGSNKKIIGGILALILFSSSTSVELAKRKTPSRKRG